MTFRPLPVMTLCVLLSLGILAMLGQWQFSKYRTSQTVLDVAPEWTSLSGDQIDNQVYYMSTVINGRSAWREIVPLEVDGDVVLATYGAIFSVETPSEPLIDLTASEQAFEEGIFRTPPEAGLFTPPSDIENRILFSFDFERIEAALGRPVRRQVFEPRQLVARDQTGEGMIDNAQADPSINDRLSPERHLGYALTWWGIGLGLIAVYLVFHMNAGRLTFRAKS